MSREGLDAAATQKVGEHEGAFSKVLKNPIKSRFTPIFGVKVPIMAWDFYVLTILDAIDDPVDAVNVIYGKEQY